MERKKCKIILLGDMMTGKTRLAEKIKDINLSENYYTPTLGVDFCTYYLDKKNVINFWDVSGNPRFECITKTYLKNERIFLLFCDVNNINSIKNLNYWLNKIRELNNIEDKLFINIICSDLKYNYFRNEKFKFPNNKINGLSIKDYLDNFSEQFKEPSCPNGEIHFITKNTNLKKLVEHIFKSYQIFNSYYPLAVDYQNDNYQINNSFFSKYCSCLFKLFRKKKIYKKSQPLLEN